jgi:hypothetical protein
VQATCWSRAAAAWSSIWLRRLIASACRVHAVTVSCAVVRDYQPLIGVGWDDARECVEAEARWLDRAAKAPTAEEFDQILSGAPEEEAPDDFDWLFRCLDVGVAGLALVLSAACYVTCFSCRTHPSRAGDHMPQVIMAAEPQRVRVLAGYAAHADCGLESMESGLVCVYAASVEHLHALAQALLAARAGLEQLPQPAWLPRVQEYLSGEDGDEFEWADDEIG